MHTGPRAFCILMALAAAGSEVALASDQPNSIGKTPVVASGHYRVESMLVSVPRATVTEIPESVSGGFYSQAVVAHLISSSKSNFLSFPSVEATQTQAVSVDFTHPVQFPHDKVRELGPTLTLTPTSTSNGSYKLVFENVKLGFTDPHADQPVFSNQGITTVLTTGAQPPQQGYFCYSLPQRDKSIEIYDANGCKWASLADANERQLLFVKISRG